MKITKIFNNNSVATLAEDQTEMILTGSGIGFHKKVGDEIEEARIEKRYVIDTSKRNQFYKLFQNTPVVYLHMCEHIYDHASLQLQKELSNQMIIALTDHISFAIEREKQGIVMPNLLLNEIRVLYKKEYEISIWALAYIQEQTGVKLPMDEAGYIAMHIVNSAIGGSQNTAGEIITFSKGVLEIIRETFHIELKEDDPAYIRITTHLKYLAQRVLDQTEIKQLDEDDSMYYMLLHKHLHMQQCMDKIYTFVKEDFAYVLSRQEAVYVMIHILKILQS